MFPIGFDLTLFRAYDQAILILSRLLSWGPPVRRDMMHTRRVLTLAVTVAALVSAPSLVAQQPRTSRGMQSPDLVLGQQDGGEQELSPVQRDVRALVLMVNAVADGTQPAPADISLEWEGHHFMQDADGGTYTPFTLAVDAAPLSAPGAALYVRAVSKTATAEPDAADDPAAVRYPWDDISFLDVGPDGRLQRAMFLSPGEYELFIAFKEESPAEEQDNQPPAKAALLRRDITVPDFNSPNLAMSSLLLGNIQALAAPLPQEEQRDNPYTFGRMQVDVSTDYRLAKSSELQALFWIYGTQQNDGKPDIQIEYTFHRQTADGEAYFNKTPPQVLNASTLPPEFNVATDPLAGILVVPLASFPAGEYRLEIKLIDSISGETLIHSQAFFVEA